VIAGQIVADYMPRRPPELRGPRGPPCIGRNRVVRIVLELKCDVMNAHLAQVEDVDHVVIAIARQWRPTRSRGRNACGLLDVYRLYSTAFDWFAPKKESAFAAADLQ
jgi:hypothetical protein